MQGLCAQLTGGSISLLSLFLYIYIYMQCSSMQGLCAQLTGGPPPNSIYVCSVAVCKASVLI